MKINKYLFSCLLLICVGVGFVLGNYQSLKAGKPIDANGSQVAATQVKTFLENKPKKILTKRSLKNNVDKSDDVVALAAENQNLKERVAILEKQLTTRNEKQIKIASHQALSPEALSEQAMEHMKMLMKKRVMEISDKQLEDFERRFALADTSSDWSKEYQVQLESFIQNNNDSGTHYIQDLRCKSKLCRLEIASDDPSAWNDLIADMINQKWYSSLMLRKPQMTESGTLVYFLPERH